MALALSIAGTLGSEAGRLVEEVLNRCSVQRGKGHNKGICPGRGKERGSRRVRGPPRILRAHLPLPIQGTSTIPHRAHLNNFRRQGTWENISFNV